MNITRDRKKTLNSIDGNGIRIRPECKRRKTTKNASTQIYLQGFYWSPTNLMIMRFSNFDDIVVYCVSEGFTFRVGTLDAFPPRLRSMSLCVLKSIGADHKHWVPQSAFVKVAVFVRYYNQNF